MRSDRSGASRRRRIALSAPLLALLAWTTASATTVDVLCDAGADPCVVDRVIVVDDMSVLDLGGRDLHVTSSGRLRVGSGTMTVLAADITIDSGGEITAQGSSSVPGGTVTVRGSSLDLAGEISVEGAPPGQVDIVVTGDVDVSGKIDASPTARAESGGTVDIEGGNVALSGEIDANGGTEDALGGDIDISATGNIDVSGTMTVVAPDGGTITLTSGAGASDGNITLTATAELVADGDFQGGFGGSIDLDASGDGVTTGVIRISGSMSVKGDDAGEEVGGGSGGCLSLSATGSVVIDNANATLSVEGGGPDGDGGEFDIVSDTGAVVVASTLDVSTAGEEGGGGALSIDAFRNIVILGEIDGTGGDGGDVAIASTDGGVTINASVVIDVRGRGIGSGGAICLESSSSASTLPAAVVSNGMLLADGGGSAGLGGAIEVLGFDSATVAGLASADGGLGGGDGGAIALTALGGPAFVAGTLRARGRGEAGGSVAIDGDRIELTGSIDVSGAGANSGNTDVGLSARGPINLAGDVIATGSPGPGGLVEVMADGDVVIGGLLSADGGAEPGGTVTVLGCTVLLCGFNADRCEGATGRIRTLGPSGTNRITGRDQALVFGTMTTALSGRNELVVRPPTSQNATILGTVTPAAVVVGDGGLTRCPVCGNGTIEPPETCDDGNTNDGDGCSAQCRREGEVVVGDVNGDSLVNEADLGFLASEIFDGDGDLLADVSGGGFGGGPGADVNGDGRITAADFTGLSEVLGGP